MPSAPARPAGARSQIGFNLVGIALGAALAALALAYGLDGMSRQRQAEGAEASTLLTRNLGGRELQFPASWFRTDGRQDAGFVSQIELRVPVELGPGGTALPVDVTLLPPSRIRTSAALLDRVYLHQFLSEQLSGPVGLVGKPLRGAEGFAGETVWYDPLSAEPFAAKCMAPVDAGAAQRCLRTVILAKGIAAVYAFDAIALERWRDFDAAVAAAFAESGIF